jgi:hypothetical protein
MQEAAAHLRENGYPQAEAKLATVNVSFKDRIPNDQGNTTKQRHIFL